MGVQRLNILDLRMQICRLSKPFVTSGGYAHSYVVSTVAAVPNAPLGQFSCVVVPYFLMAMAGTYLGVAGAALEGARKHLSHLRYTDSGWALAQLPVLQHRLGSFLGVLERTRRLIYSASRDFDAGEPDALPAIFTA